MFPQARESVVILIVTYFPALLLVLVTLYSMILFLRSEGSRISGNFGSSVNYFHSCCWLLLIIMG